MMVLGIICLILGFVLGIQLLWVAGVILLLVGLLFWVAPGFGVGGPRAPGSARWGRPRYW